MLNLFQMQASKRTTILSKECNYQIELALPQDKQRQTIESFIRNGYQKTYQAEINTFLPTLLALGNGKHLSAMGINTAQNKLQVEQYLSAPVEQMPYFSQRNVSRAHIAEMGNLYGNNRALTNPLFMLAGVALYLNDYSHVVVSATQQLIRLFNKIGIKSHFIANAIQTDFSRKNEDWGSYYQTQPLVVALSLSQIMQLIDQTPKYQLLFSEMQHDITQMLPKLGNQL